MTPASKRMPSIEMMMLVLSVMLWLGAAGAWGYHVSLQRRVQRVLIGEGPREAAAPGIAAEEDDPAEEQEGGEKGLAVKPARAATPVAPPSAELASLLKTKHIFGVPSDIVLLKGILGDKALINGQWFKIGEQRDGIKLLEVRPNVAVVDLFGERREFKVWEQVTGSMDGDELRRSMGKRGEAKRVKEKTRDSQGMGGRSAPKSEMRSLREDYQKKQRSGKLDPDEARRMREEMKSTIRSRRSN